MAGVTFVDPLAPKVPTPSMLTEVAFVVVQLSTLDAPFVILLGCAEKLIVGAPGEDGGGGVGEVGGELVWLVDDNPPPQLSIRNDAANVNTKTRRGPCENKVLNSAEWRKSIKDGTTR